MAVGDIDTPGPVGWLEMTAQALLQFGAVALDPAQIGVWSAFRPRSPRSSSTSRNDSEYHRYQRTAQRINSGSVCRYLKIAGRVVFFMISSGYQSPSAKVATQPFRNLPLLILSSTTTSTCDDPSVHGTISGSTAPLHLPSGGTSERPNPLSSVENSDLRISSAVPSR